MGVRSGAAVVVVVVVMGLGLGDGVGDEKREREGYCRLALKVSEDRGRRRYEIRSFCYGGSKSRGFAFITSLLSGGAGLVRNNLGLGIRL